MNKKKIIIVLLVIGLVAAFVGYKMYNKPHVDVAEASSDITITAANLLNDFSTDEAKANAKYLDKIVEVSGEIAKLESEANNVIVVLKTDDDFGNVRCTLSEVSSQRVTALKIGDTITLKGICTGYLMDVVLVKSEIK